MAAAPTDPELREQQTTTAPQYSAGHPWNNPFFPARNDPTPRNGSTDSCHTPRWRLFPDRPSGAGSILTRPPASSGAATSSLSSEALFQWRRGRRHPVPVLRRRQCRAAPEALALRDFGLPAGGIPDTNFPRDGSENRPAASVVGHLSRSTHRRFNRVIERSLYTCQIRTKNSAA
jgi:hypothetical protein